MTNPFFEVGLKPTILAGEIEWAAVGICNPAISWHTKFPIVGGTEGKGADKKREMCKSLPSDDLPSNQEPYYSQAYKSKGGGFGNCHQHRHGVITFRVGVDGRENVTGGW